MQNLEIFREYGARIAKEEYNGKQPRAFFDLMQDFNRIVESFDNKFTWAKVSTESLPT